MWDILAAVLLDPGGAFDEVRDRRQERRVRRLAAAGKISCALRVVDGAQPGLRRRWRRGAARVPTGFLLFEPRSSWGARMRIAVRSATLQPAEDVPRRRPRALGRQARLIVLVTPQATLEWLVPQEQVRRAMGVVSRS